MYRRWPLVRQIKLLVVRFLRLRGAPEEISKGLALGIFIGLTPTFGFQMLLAVCLAVMLKENKFAAVLGVWVTNPFTAPFIYALEYESGRVLLNMDYVHIPASLSFSALKSLGWEVLLPLGVGSLLWAALTAMTVYLAAIRIIPITQTWKIPRWPRRPRRRQKEGP
ncbi:protein of unknown function DUF2062 [Syntrophotalea carbinolica DSM 2380]|uniref:DUF2062 domain-containing protein n=1 Tax=Syntrophotalea carbinolica (strain DSM 2380 / NBRC 103641 / GraBd1) TaxID=338963 RepID=Q3A3G7_SYNC1|nr:DUF2062 domain-containing protein [Syntrophotalea carbinolica]ABA89090.1 protein of unknown function DUF2062 [Syntrophotalea carbinolica DSM 2380]